MKHPHKLKVMLNELMGEDATEILNSGGVVFFWTSVWPNRLQTCGVLLVMLVDGVVTLVILVTLIAIWHNHGQRTHDGRCFSFQDTSTTKP